MPTTVSWSVLNKMVLGCVSKLEGLSLASVHTAAHRTIYSVTPVGLQRDRLAQGQARSGKGSLRERLTQGQAHSRKGSLRERLPQGKAPHRERLHTGKGSHRDRLTQGKAGNRKHCAGLADAFRMEISSWIQCFLDNFIDTHR